MPLPFEGNFPITQGFGASGAQVGNWTEEFNKGYDYATPGGTPISAVVSGTVIAAGDANDGWGTSVKIRDAQGNVHNYGHLSEARVVVGATVEAGALVGLSGNTGLSTGPHLSYDVSNASGEFFDPWEFLGLSGPSADRTPTSGAVPKAGLASPPLDDDDDIFNPKPKQPKESEDVERARINILSLRRTGMSDEAIYDYLRNNLKISQSAADEAFERVTEAETRPREPEKERNPRGEAGESILNNWATLRYPWDRVVPLLKEAGWTDEQIARSRPIYDSLLANVLAKPIAAPREFAPANPLDVARAALVDWQAAVQKGDVDWKLALGEWQAKLDVKKFEWDQWNAREGQRLAAERERGQRIQTATKEILPRSLSTPFVNLPLIGQLPGAPVNLAELLGQLPGAPQPAPPPFTVPVPAPPIIPPIPGSQPAAVPAIPGAPVVPGATPAVVPPLRPIRGRGRIT